MFNFNYNTGYTRIDDYCMYNNVIYKNNELLDRLKNSMYNTPMDEIVINLLSNNTNMVISDTEDIMEQDYIPNLVLLAYNKQKLDVLINSVYPEVRVAVAKQCYGLPILCNDKDWRVRLTAMYCSFKYAEMALDPNPAIRAMAAKLDTKLEMLINDASSQVRIEVAMNKYKLDVLINDPSPDVLIAIVNLGYRLDYIAKRNIEIVNAYMASKGLALDILIHSDDEKVKKLAYENASIWLKIKSILKIKK